jgi:hypothetical protein
MGSFMRRRAVLSILCDKGMPSAIMVTPLKDYQDWMRIRMYDTAALEKLQVRGPLFLFLQLTCRREFHFVSETRRSVQGACLLIYYDTPTQVQYSKANGKGVREWPYKFAPREAKSRIAEVWRALYVPWESSPCSKLLHTKVRCDLLVLASSRGLLGIYCIPESTDTTLTRDWAVCLSAFTIDRFRRCFHCSTSRLWRLSQARPIRSGSRLPRRAMAHPASQRGSSSVPSRTFRQTPRPRRQNVVR